MTELTNSEAKKSTERRLDLATPASSKVYTDVAYSLNDHAREDSEGRKEKHGMSMS